MHKKYRFYIILASFLLIYVLITRLLPGDDLKFTFDNVSNLNDNWSYSSRDNDIEYTNLPNHIVIPRNQEYQIEKLLPESFKLPQAIMIRSSMQDIRIYLDDEIVFDNTQKSNEGLFKIPRLSVWYVVDIPEASDKKVLKLSVSSPIDSMSGRINGITYGQSSNLIGNLIFNKLHIILISFATLLVGSIVTLSSLTLSRDSDKRLQYISVFFISISLWLISEADIMQVFSSNQYFLASVSYLMLPISGISFTLYIKTVALEKYSNLLDKFIYFYITYVALSMILQLLINRAYIESFKYFIFTLLVEVIIIFHFLIYESLKNKDKNSMKYLSMCFVLIFTVIIEAFNFLTENFMNVSNLSSYGVGLFLILLTIDTLNYINIAFQKEGEALYLRDVAYRDPLTGGLNRAAFEKDIDVILSANDHEHFRLTILDLNDFKSINDKYGHSTGDEVLIDFHKILIDSFTKDSYCYRVGGDEFMVISYDLSEFNFKESIKLMYAYITLYNEAREYSINTSYGTGIYNYEKSFGSFKNEIDSKMYVQKNSLKSAN